MHYLFSYLFKYESNQLFIKLFFIIVEVKMNTINYQNNIESEDNDSIFKCSSQLAEKGYSYTTDGLLCPLEDDYFIKIGRTDKKYSYSIVKKEDNDIRYVSSSYTCKEAITEYKESRTKQLTEYWSNTGNTTDIKPLLSAIELDLLNEHNFSQVNKTFDAYKKEIQKSSEVVDDSVIKEIEKRRNPKLNPFKRKEAENIEAEIKEVGFVGYLAEYLDNIHKGEHRNIYLKIMGAYIIIIGKASFLIETIANSEEGKSLEDWIVFNLIIPQQFVYRVNSITKSSFTRYAEKSEYYFDRMILIFGDLGRKNAFQSMEELFNIIKVLITEKEYVRDLSDKADDGNYSNKQLKLKCESIGGVYSSVKNDFTEGDSQMESRTISCTPNGATDDEVMDLIIDLECEISPETEAKKESVKKLEKFQNYILYCATMDLTIINPYGQVFKRYAKKSDTPKRELKQTMKLFDAYCKLTYFNCDDINGHMVASENQLNEFMQDICLQNALIPYESDFLKMIMAKGKETELEIIDTEEDDVLEDCYETVLDSFDDIDAEVFSDLTYTNEEKAVKTLLKLYKLGGTALSHEKNVFFRISDIRRQYSKYKAYKNIDDIQKLIHRLVKKGYIDSIEYQDGKQNIYYLTEQCNDISTSFELTEEDKESAKDFLKKVGVNE